MNKKTKEVIVKYTILTITLFIASLSFNIFISPLNIVLGGNNGVAVLIEFIFKISPFVTLILLSIFFLILSYFFLDKKQTISIAYASLIYPFLVKFSYPIARFISLDINDLLLASIYIGIISGITNGIILNLGFNNGGVNVIGNILYKYYKISYSKSMFLLNALIVILGGIYIGPDNLLYAVVILYINSYVIDKVILNQSKYKCFEIITKKEKLVEDYLENVLHRNYTKIKLNQEKYLLVTAIKTKEYSKLKNFIKTIDKDAFFLIRNSYDAKITY